MDLNILNLTALATPFTLIATDKPFDPLPPNPPTDPECILVGPDQGAVGSLIGPFSLTLNSPAPEELVITLSDGNSGGVFSPPALILGLGETSKTFRYSPSIHGTLNIYANDKSIKVSAIDVSIFRALPWFSGLSVK